MLWRVWSGERRGGSKLAKSKVPDDFAVICQCGKEFRYPREQYGTIPSVKRKCPDCGVINVFTTDNAHVVEHTYASPVTSDLADGPDLISASGAIHYDLKEVVKCINATAYRASALMCRRCLEAALTEKGCTGDSLEALIVDASSKGLLRPEAVAPAHAIQLIGNKAAHQAPGQTVVFSPDYFKRIDHAKAALTATEGILRKIYNIPEPTI